MRAREQRLGHLLAPREGELSRGLLATGLGLVGQLAAVGLLASAAWLITTASLRPPVLTLTVAIAGVRLFALLRGTARYGERLASHDLALRALARVRVWAFSRVEPLVPGTWPGARRGDLLARFVSDVDGLQDLYVRVALPLAGAMATAAVTVATAALLDPAAGLVLGAGLVVATLAFPLLTAALGVYGGSQQAESRGERDSLVVELLHGSSELAVFGAQGSMVARVLGAERELARHARKASVARGLGRAMSVALAGLLVAAVVVASLPALDAGRISGVVVAVLAFLALGSADAVSSLPESFAKLAGVLGGARRLLTLASPERSGPGDAADRAEVGSGAARDRIEAVIRAPAMAARPPAIALEGVSVLYGSRRYPALEHVDLVVKPGAHIALTGQSGSGKTTLGHLLMGFVQPAEGRVTFGGVDLRLLGSDAARRLVAWAPQGPHVFRTSLAANLRLSRPAATDEELVAVLGQVGLGDWLGHLQAGLGTVLGERGNTVSGGERQRLGVARALLADRPVLVLDEPTAHLDDGNESLLRAAVLAASQAKTLIWVTHRLVGLEDFDEVVTLRRGRRVPGAVASSAIGGKTGRSGLASMAMPATTVAPDPGNAVASTPARARLGQQGAASSAFSPVQVPGTA